MMLYSRLFKTAKSDTYQGISDFVTNNRIVEISVRKYNINL